MTIPAKYEKGVFRPLQAVPLREGTVVEVLLPEEVSAKDRDRLPIHLLPACGRIATMADSVEYINRLRRELDG